MNRKDVVIVVLGTLCLLVTLFSVIPAIGVLPYSPWMDVNDDGVIDAKDYQAVKSRIPSIGTPLDKAYLAYDTGGYLNITTLSGQYYTLTHNMGIADMMVDIIGKTTLDEGAHQKYLGLTNHASGWTRTYKQTFQNTASSLIQTPDGGYAIVGSSSGNISLVKTDSVGIVQWNQTYGGAGVEEGCCVVKTYDGGYAIVGFTNSYGYGGFDVYLVKTDSLGNMQWNQTYGGPNDDWGSSVIQTPDEGYAIAGCTNSYGSGGDAYLVTTYSDGNIRWNQTYGGAGMEEASSVVAVWEDFQWRYVMAGRSDSTPTTNAYLVKADMGGNMLWNMTYGGDFYAEAYSVINTMDNGCAMAGAVVDPYTMVGGGYLVKTDSAGNMQWNQTYTETGTLRSIIHTAGGGYAMAGGNGDQISLLEVNHDGNRMWYKSWPGDGGNLIYGYSVIQTTDGGFAALGHKEAFTGGWVGYLVKTDVELGLTWFDSTADAITLYRGEIDPYWNYVRIRLWALK